MNSKTLVFARKDGKAELLQVGTFFRHPFICTRNFITKKVGNRRN